MSLLPWAIKGASPHVVTDQQHFTRDGKAVLMLNFEGSQFEESGATNATYDLRVGDSYMYYGDDKPRHLAQGQKMKIPPGRAATIEALEQVCFPDSVLGLIVPKEGQLRKGISTSPTIIHPGYPKAGSAGSLHVTVLNHSSKTASLKHLDRFCALCLFQVEREGLIPYGKEGKKLEAPERPSFSLRGLVASWGPTIGACTGVVALIVSILAVIFS